MLRLWVTMVCVASLNEQKYQCGEESFLTCFSYASHLVIKKKYIQYIFKFKKYVSLINKSELLLTK